MLTDANVATLFNMSASTVANLHLYDRGLTLPSRLPHGAAKALLSGLLNGLTEMRATSTAGYRLGLRLLQPGNASLADLSDADAAADFAAVVAHADATMTEAALRPIRPTRAGAAASASSSSGSSSPMAPPLPLAPLPMPAAVVAPHLAAAAAPFAVDTTLSLTANVERLLQRRMNRALSAAERQTVGAALDDALSIFQAGGAAARSALLDAPMGEALINPGAAQAWASAVEVATEGDAAQSVAALAAALVSACSTVAAVLFASAVGL